MTENGCRLRAASNAFLVHVDTTLLGQSKRGQVDGREVQANADRIVI
jgi:hypothetical protein